MNKNIKNEKNIRKHLYVFGLEIPGPQFEMEDFSKEVFDFVSWPPRLFIELKVYNSQLQISKIKDYFSDEKKAFQREDFIEIKGLKGIEGLALYLIKSYELIDEVLLFDQLNSQVQNISLLGGNHKEQVESYPILKLTPHLKSFKGNNLDNKNDYYLEWTQKVKLSCVHSHFKKDLSPSKNKELFKKCASHHGHEYELGATFEFNVSLDLKGIRIDILKVNKVMKQFKSKYQNKDLNNFIENPTGEILSQFFYEQFLSYGVLKENLKSIALKETYKNDFYYSSFYK